MRTKRAVSRASARGGPRAQARLPRAESSAVCSPPEEGVMTDVQDPFAQFKAMQREGWNLFLPLEQFTMIPAGKLVAFAKITPGQAVLDVACGTGVVAISAARAGARVRALDLSPTLLERARENARVTGVEVDFVAGDAEALPYPDAAFDVVLSQFGHK